MRCDAVKVAAVCSFVAMGCYVNISEQQSMLGIFAVPSLVIVCGLVRDNRWFLDAATALFTNAVITTRDIARLVMNGGLCIRGI